MICKFCGAGIPDNSRVCFACGAALTETEVTSVSSAPFQKPVTAAPNEEPVNTASNEAPVNTASNEAPVNTASNEASVNIAPNENGAVNNGEQIIDLSSEPDYGFGFSTPAETSENVTPVDSSNSNTKQIFKIAAVFVLIAAVVGIGALVVKGLLNSSSKQNGIKPLTYKTVYNELYVCKNINKKTEPFLVSSDFHSDDYVITEDCQYIIYLEHEQRNGYIATYDLVYKELYNKKDQGTLLDTGVRYLADETRSIDAVYYMKSGDIYVANSNGETRKLLSNSDIRKFSENNDKLLAVSNGENDDYYYQDEYSAYPLKVEVVDLTTYEVETISECATEIRYNESLSKIYYIENNILYLCIPGDETIQITESSTEIRSGEMFISGDDLYYFLKSYEPMFSAFVDDSCKDDDLKIKEPDWNDYAPDYDDYKKEKYNSFWQEYYTVTDYDAYNKAREEADKKYDADYEKYREVQKRNELRMNLEGTARFREYELYRFDGESTKIAEHINSFYIAPVLGEGSNSEPKKLCLSILRKPFSDIPAIDIKDIESTDDITTYVDEQKECDVYTVSGESISKMFESSEFTDFSNLKILFYNSDDDSYVVRKTIYSEFSDDYTNELYRVPGNSDFENAELIADSYYDMCYLKGEFITFSDYDSSSASYTLNYNGDSLYGSQNYVFAADGDDSGLYYITNYNKNTMVATVWKYSNGTSEKIVDAARSSDFGIVDGKYVYLSHYNTADYCGTLTVKDGDDFYEIDSGVLWIDNENVSYSTGLIGIEY